MKKTIAFAVAAMMAVSLTACGSSAASSNSAESVAASSAVASGAESSGFKVGIINYVDDPSLNQIQTAIEEELAANGISYDSYNAQADQSTITTIASQMIENGVDMIIPIATPTAMVVQNLTEENQIPVVFAAVSDPVGAGLVADLNAPGANITGTSDALDTANVFNLIEALNPDVTKIGLLYDASQDSSTKAIEEAEGRLNELGIEYEAKTGTTTDELALAAQALCDDGVQVVFTPTDNTVQVAEPSIYTIFEEAGVQHFGGADSFALVGAFCGYGVDYANLGTETAKMAVNILENAQNPAEVPVQFFDNGKASINTDVCAALGLDFTEVSKTLEPLCTKVEGLATSAEF